jgi:hypothetical protein
LAVGVADAKAFGQFVGNATAEGSGARSSRFSGPQERSKQDDQSAGDDQGQRKPEEWRDVRHFRNAARAAQESTVLDTLPD